MPIATVKTAVKNKFGRRVHSKKLGTGDIREAIVETTKKHGYALHTDGRFYVPESKRGRGVGYGHHGRG